MSRIHIFLLVLGLMLAGSIRSLYLLFKLREKKEFTEEYLKNLKCYYESQGNDGNAYTWMIHRSVRMQADLGKLGVFDYRPPASGYMIRNYQVILNMVPELRNTMKEDSRWITSSLAYDYYSCLFEVLIRHLGTLDDRIYNTIKNIRNPIVNLRIGLQLIILIPFFLLEWVGLRGLTLSTNVVVGFIIRILTGIATLVSIVSALVSLVIGWDSFIAIIHSWKQ